MLSVGLALPECESALPPFAPAEWASTVLAGFFGGKTLPTIGGNSVPPHCGPATYCESLGNRTTTTSLAVSAAKTTPRMLGSFDVMVVK